MVLYSVNMVETRIDGKSMLEGWKFGIWLYVYVGVQSCWVYFICPMLSLWS